MTPDPTTDLPRLAVFHDDHSASIFTIFGASRGLCQIVWIVGWWTETLETRQLSRFGQVVDVTGMDEAAAVDHIAGHRLDGVIVFTDKPMRLAARVADKVGLPFHSPESARLLTDKLAQRTALRESGLPTPAFAAVQASDFSATVPFPAVLKPRAGSGSRDTFKIDDADQLAEAIGKCDPHEEFILEEWLPDRIVEQRLGSDIVSVESIAREGEITHIMVTERFPFAEPFRETGSFMPSNMTSGQRDALSTLAAAAAKALHIGHGVLHTEVKLTPDGPRVLEVNGRAGGGIDELLTRLGGPSLLSWSIQLALGLDIGPIAEIPQSPVAFFRWIVAPMSATAVTSVSGLAELKELPGIDEVRLNRQPGDRLDSREGSPSAHVVRIDGLAGDHAELSTLVNQGIPSTLHVMYDSE